MGKRALIIFLVFGDLLFGFVKLLLSGAKLLSGVGKFLLVDAVGDFAFCELSLGFCQHLGVFVVLGFTSGIFGPSAGKALFGAFQETFVDLDFDFGIA